MRIIDAINMLKSLIALLEHFESSCATLDEIYKGGKQKKQKTMSDEEIKVNIGTLIKLGSLDKNEWINFAKINSIKIDTRTKDSSRDILNKILRYLDNNPSVKEKIEKDAEASTTVHSPELTKALKILLSK